MTVQTVINKVCKSSHLCSYQHIREANFTSKPGLIPVKHGVFQTEARGIGPRPGISHVAIPGSVLFNVL